MVPGFFRQDQLGSRNILLTKDSDPNTVCQVFHNGEIDAMIFCLSRNLLTPQQNRQMMIALIENM